MKTINSFYPVLSTYEGPKLVAFLKQALGFEAVFEADWYWHLTLPGQSEINVGVVQADHASLPATFRQPIQGLLLNFEIDEVAEFYQQHLKTDWNIILPLRDEPWGQRHFIVEVPVEGLLLDFIEIIPPSDSFKDHYVGDANPVS